MAYTWNICISDIISYDRVIAIYWSSINSKYDIIGDSPLQPNKTITSLLGSNDISSSGTTITASIDNIFNRINANGFSNYVQLTSKYTTQNPFICPSDGYVRLYHIGIVRIFGSNETTFNTDNFLASLYQPNGGEVGQSTFVKKGMKVVVAKGGNYLTYIPISW